DFHSTGRRLLRRGVLVRALLRARLRGGKQSNECRIHHQRTDRGAAAGLLALRAAQAGEVLAEATMTLNGWLQLAVFFLAVLAVTKPLGIWMTKVFTGEKTWMSRVLGPVERLIYLLCRVDAAREQHWTAYTAAMLMFSVASLLVLYAIERLQAYLPFNPQQFTGVVPDLAFNTAASFTSNTNWQAYSGETTMSYFVQMAGLAFHNFASAAVGIVLAIALVRGIARREAKTIGNFFVDLTRCTLYLLLPLCIVGALVLVSQGIVQNFSPYTKASIVEPQKIDKTDDKGNQTTE